MNNYNYVGNNIELNIFVGDININLAKVDKLTVK